MERSRTENADAADGSGFAQAVSDLEAWLHDEETAATKALDIPITQALHSEKTLRDKLRKKRDC